MFLNIVEISVILQLINFSSSSAYLLINISKLMICEIFMDSNQAETQAPYTPNALYVLYELSTARTSPYKLSTFRITQ